MLKLPDLDAVAICTPPQVRHEIASEALLAGKSVLLEKPPAATLSELEDLKRIATQAGKTLFTAWHAQYNDGVDAAAKALAGQALKSPADHLEGRCAALASGPGMDLAGRRLRRLRSRHQRALDPEPHHAAADLRQAGRARIPRQPRCADRRQPRSSRPVLEAKTAGGVRLAPDRPANLGHRDRDSLGPAPAARPKAAARLEIDGKVVVDEASAEYHGHLPAVRRAAESAAPPM